MDEEGNEVLIDPRAGDAVQSAWFAFERLAEATTIGAQGEAFIELSNHMADVASWLPAYDPDTGQVGGPQ